MIGMPGVILKLRNCDFLKLLDALWGSIMRLFLFTPDEFMVILCPQWNYLYSVSSTEEYTKDKKKFFKNAEEFTKKNSEKRPSD